ncbi:hypothetical protein HMPREF0372_04197 [Flavonifractor plautii ATCC 29863]|uniref:Uncharacterized protein n=1 Tax=Flavonifractor plautii ATCC 29863 TaxID=411475 RepID=G9YXC9_FLAPL|nr:hypothetical protein HMPREF0372_04197 [Flavonifractor plautii ATCC 29863]
MAARPAGEICPPVRHKKGGKRKACPVGAHGVRLPVPARWKGAAGRCGHRPLRCPSFDRRKEKPMPILPNARGAFGAPRGRRCAQRQGMRNLAERRTRADVGIGPYES